MIDLLEEYERIRLLEPQARGYAFERLLCSIFENEGLDYTGAFRPLGEQIDGALYLHGRNYLVEAKWRQNQSSASDVGSFRDTVNRKLTGTLGLFWSMSGFSDECIPALTCGNNLTVILFDNTDLEGIINGEISFVDLLDHKIKAAGRYGTVNFPWSGARAIQNGVRAEYRLLALVEGSYDEIILRSLFTHVGMTSTPIVWPVGGKSKMIDVAPTFAHLFLEGPKSYCLLVMDRDDSDGNLLDDFRKRMHLTALVGAERLHIAFPNPTIWSWVSKNPELPKPDLFEYMQSFNWNSVITKNPDLKELVNFLKHIE